ncbi:MAG: indole-3-glycerol phosphate synthase TrpC [Bacteroidales bacterium]
MTILEEIISVKKKEVAEQKRHTSLRYLEKSKFFSGETMSLRQSLKDQAKTGIIAEFKRKSPSKGVINSMADVRYVTTGYASEGASGLSVLTDNKFFGGTIDDLLIARKFNSIPVLRKEFIIDEFQVVESKASGADAILLLAAALENKEIVRFARLSHSLGMEVILEVHSMSELELINEHIDIIGVNNRDLRTFRVDLNVSVKIAEEIPEQFLKISESGISFASAVSYLRRAGYDGFLIGEHFMKTEDPVSAFSAFINEIKSGNVKD